MCDADKRELFMFFSEATTPLIHQQAQIYVPSLFVQGNGCT